MVNWILNTIGILVYFITKYANRTYKTRFSFKFWLKDNWPELSTTMLINIALMMLLMQPETNINIDEWLKANVPFALQIGIKPAFSLLLGLGFSAGLYELFKQKTKR